MFPLFPFFPLNPLEHQLLQLEAGPAGPRLCLRTATRIDTGRWLRRSPLWLCATADELITLAVSRRRYLARIPLAECHASYYNHATGELVIEPAESLPIKHIKLSLAEALRILEILNPEHRQLETSLC